MGWSDDRLIPSTGANMLTPLLVWALKHSLVVPCLGICLFMQPSGGGQISGGRKVRVEGGEKWKRMCCLHTCAALPLPELPGLPV